MRIKCATCGAVLHVGKMDNQQIEVYPCSCKKSLEKPGEEKRYFYFVSGTYAQGGQICTWNHIPKLAFEITSKDHIQKVETEIEEKGLENVVVTNFILLRTETIK